MSFRRLAVLLCLLVLACSPSGCIGCGGDRVDDLAPPVERVEPEASALHARFPDHAREVLEAGPALGASDEGFALDASRGAAPAGHGGLVAKLPRSASDALRFELPSGFAAQVREVGASGEGAIAGHAVAYAREGGTSYWAANATGYEEWLLLDEGVATGARAAASWEVEGGTLAQTGAVIELRDEAGVARMRVTAPVAYAAGGERVEARLAVCGSTIELWVDAGGAAVLVDPQWTSTGLMNDKHRYVTAQMLDSGKVLVATGTNGAGPYTTVCELYDPATNAWSLTGPVAAGRAAYTTTLLDDGRVLLAGGYNSTLGTWQGGTIYDPVAGTWSLTGAMVTPRSLHVAALLQSGKVLAAGGNGTGSSAAAEVYDPALNQWTAVAPMNAARSQFAAAIMPNGKVLVAGGSAATAEVYDPVANTWTATPSMSMSRSSNTATLLQSGKVLVAGGGSATADVYDPASNTWTATGAMTLSRSYHTATLLGTGKVLVAGGQSPSVTATAELYDPATNAWTATASMAVARQDFGATLLVSGQVLAAGGYGASGEINTAEVFGGIGALGTACATGNDCQSGFCADGVCCNTACAGGLCDACSVAAGAAVNGTCALFSGNACNDGSACTQNDVCQAGVCVGSSAVVCPPPADGCHTQGFCNPANGVCSTPLAANGTPCSDGNACTQNDTCQAGVCNGGTPVFCAPLDQCHLAGSCLPATGCSNPAKADGTACNDGSLCTTGDMCLAGACVAGSAVVCPPPVDACHTSACNPATGTCASAVIPNGQPCDDGNACSQGEFCQGGVCGGGAPVFCAPLDQCHLAGACLPATGCSNPPKSDGTACNDANPCSQTDTCQAGACVGGNPVTCAPSDTCHDVGVCDAATGACSHPVKADGSACDDGNACTQSETCAAGVCGGGSAVPCAAPTLCQEAGACNPVNGICSYPPKPDGTACGMGTCTAGVCSTPEGTSSSSSGSGSGGGSATGTGGSTGSGSASTSSGAGGSSGGSKGGCGCEVGGDRDLRGAWLALGLLVAARRRRSRRPHRREVSDMLAPRS